MNKLLSALITAVFAATTLTAVADEAPRVSASAMTSAQHDKMKMCRKDARDQNLRGPERKAFIKDCMSK